MKKADWDRLNPHEQRLVRRVQAIDAGIAAARKSIEEDIAHDDPAGAAALIADLARLRRALIARFATSCTIVGGIFE